MSDALWLEFSERVRVEGNYRVRCLVLAGAPDAIDLAHWAERNLGALASLAAIEERRVDTADDDNPVLQELTRLDAKLNALVDIVNRVLVPTESMPPRFRLQFNALGAVLPADAVPGATFVLLQLHFDACPSLPLEIPAQVERRLDDGRLFLRFLACPDALSEALERLVFRHHRRKVAEARQSST